MKLWAFSIALLCSMSAWAEIDGDPLYANITDTNGATFYAWRPFYSSSVEGERWRKDYLWPLYTRKGFKDEQYSRLLFFGYSMDFSPDTDRERTWLLPFYFQGTSAEGEDYFALFPLGGKICEFLGRDRIVFALFPLYVKSHINDVHTTSVLWPIASKTSGENVERFRIWPLYGSNHLQNEFEKKYILWPIYNSVQYTNDRNPGGGFILFPLCGRVKTEQADNYWVIPPLFRYARSDQQWIVNAPWPFIQLADGEVYKRYIWPLYGKKEHDAFTKQFFLWPLIWNGTTEYSAHVQHRRRLVPLFTYESEVGTKATDEHEVDEVFSRYWKLWPLMSWERNEDASRFRLLELWPLRNTPGIERNWAPWWTLYKRTASDDETGHHVLWGLYRQTRTPERFEWSLLKGFAGYKKSGDSRTVRVLFMSFGDQEEQP